MALARKAWRRVNANDIRGSWERESRSLMDTLPALQVRAASIAADGIPLMLAEQGDYAEPDGMLNPNAFGEGYAASGIDLETYYQAPVMRTLHAIRQGVSATRALTIGMREIGTITILLVDDTHRSAAGVGITQRAKVGWMRVESPGCCSRCLILTGRVYRFNRGFLRHPHCHGMHVPVRDAAKARDSGLITDPMDAFREMGEAEQDRVFGRAGAQAIRDGADIYQVVNSRRGMAGIGPGGRRRTIMTTSEGTTKYGWSRLINKTNGRQAKRRLTPEGIYSFNLGRKKTIELLKREGYILPDDWRSKVPEIRRGEWLHDNTWRQGRYETMTAAEKRLQNARLRYEAALEGRNPYGEGDVTPEILAKTENSYRRWLTSGGQIYTQ